MTAPAIVWFRNDLRLADNPALMAAVDAGGPVIPVYVLDDEVAGQWRAGGAARWWLHHSLTSLGADLAKLGASLILRRGDAAEVIKRLARETKAGHVFWNRRYEGYGIEQDKGLKAALKRVEIDASSFNAALTAEPWEIEQKSGRPYKVYTPYSRVWFERGLPPRPLSAPKKIKGADGVKSDDLDDWGFLPERPDWAGGLREAWRPGEAAAIDAADGFLDGPVEEYGEERNFPASPGTSRLSPYLHFGEVGPRQLYHAAANRFAAKGRELGPAFPWVRQLCWREFAYHNLYYHPDLGEAPLRPEFGDFPWVEKDGQFRAWARGQTGYPIVDAGMRELWHTGYMHNRVRMIVGSFLTKDLLIPWQKGALWFWDCLCDGDLANNSMGWQWVAGCGNDAAPYFRIFNPVTQGEKFDPEGAYVRRWVPELAKLPEGVIHKPFTASADVLTNAGVELGRSYPQPIVEHAAARQAALAAFQALRKAA